jgi:glycosyltransferase involved in cell wall biosynthesis
MIAIVPAWNEAPTIAAVLRALMGPFDGRVLVVDDGSTDETVSEADGEGASVLSTPKNLGKGQAMRYALSRISKSEDVAFFDADLLGFRSQHAHDLLDAFSQGYDMVCGLRDWGSFSNAAQLALPLLTGERIFKRAVLDRIPEDCWNGYGIETAMNDAVARMGGKTALLFMLGVSIRTKAQKDGFVAGNLRHWRMYDAIGEVKQNLKASEGASCATCK